VIKVVSRKEAHGLAAVLYVSTQQSTNVSAQLNRLPGLSGALLEPSSNRWRKKYTFHFLQTLALHKKGAQRVGVVANEREFLSFRLEVHEEG